MSGLEPLPEGWTSANLSELLRVVEAGSRPKGGVREIREGVPSIGGEHLSDEGVIRARNTRFVPESFATTQLRGWIELGDVLIVKDGATTGKTAFVDETFPHSRALVNEHVLRLQTHAEVSPKFVYYYLRSERGSAEVMKDFRGAAQGGISRSFAEKVSIPLPSVAEQRRIVAKLDAALDRLRETRSALVAAQTLLRRYRESVLEAAFRGDLTIEWRAKHRLTDSWESVSLGDVVDSLRGGTSATSLKSTTSWPVLRSSAVRQGTVDFSDLSFLPEDQPPGAEHLISDGDLLITRLSGSLEYVGNCAEVRGLRNRRIAYPDRVFRARLAAGAHAPYVMWAFAVKSLRKEMEAAAKSTAGHQRISLGDVRRFRLPWPTLGEQIEIARLIGEVLRVADAQADCIDIALSRLSDYERAVLARAFRGELVPRDPNDAPATVLLERIRAERAQNGAAPRARAPRKKRASR